MPTILLSGRRRALEVVQPVLLLAALSRRAAFFFQRAQLHAADLVAAVVPDAQRGPRVATRVLVEPVDGPVEPRQPRPAEFGHGGVVVHAAAQANEPASIRNAGGSMRVD